MNNDERDQLVAEKLARLRGGAPGRVLDLFSGCGGMTLGFTRAGFEPITGIEKDKHAAASYAANFHPDDRPVHSRPVDIRKVSSPAKTLERRGCEAPFRSIDVIIGGPPCPAFSRAGRAKLAFPWDPRKVSRADGFVRNAHLADERVDLHKDYLRFVRALAPVAIVMENVPEFLNHGGENHAKLLCKTLARMGYIPTYTVLNAASYGVPQWRDRFVLMAVHRKSEQEPSFPRASHHTNRIPVGYKGRITHLRLPGTSGAEADADAHFRQAPTPIRDAAPPVTAGDAIGDLPRISFSWDAELGVTRIEPTDPTCLGYEREPSAFGTLMRSWPGQRSAPDAGLYNATRRLTMLTGRDERLFEEMPQGAEYPVAYELGTRLGEDAVQKEEATLGRPLRQTECDAIMAKYRPPYDPTKFANKWWKLVRDGPSRTLTAHIGKDTYSHIHYDDDQARVITVQEAARLQSIPDSFILEGSMNEQFRQIGNAVPPLLAWNIAEHLRDCLGLVPTASTRLRRRVRSVNPDCASVNAR